MPKNRSILLGYLLVALTGGIFGFIWACLMMRDVNRLKGDRRIPSESISILMGVGYIGTAICLVLDSQVILPSDLEPLVVAIGNVLLIVTFGSFALSIGLPRNTSFQRQAV